MSEKIDLIQDQLWLSFNSDSSVATLHFNIQKTRNAISFQVAEQLCAFSRVIGGQHPTHPLALRFDNSPLLVLVLRSHCRDVFLSGGDLKELTILSASEGSLFIERMCGFTHMLRTSPLVSIAVLNGLAAGGGAEIAMAADLRVAVSPSAQLQFAQTTWGVPAGWGMMGDLRSKNVFASERRRGIAMAAQEKLDLNQLIQHQLIEARFDASENAIDDCERWIDELARRLATCPQSLRSELICHRPTLPADKLDAFDKILFTQHWLGTEHRNRLQSFLDSRSQKPKGHETNDKR